MLQSSNAIEHVSQNRVGLVRVAEVDIRVVGIEAMWLQHLGADAPPLAAHTQPFSLCPRGNSITECH